MSHRKTYTKGQINKIIDSLLHPLAKQNQKLLILDGFLHALIEKNPTLSARKFIAYNLPSLIPHLLKEDENKSKPAGNIARRTMRLTWEADHSTATSKTLSSKHYRKRR